MPAFSILLTSLAATITTAAATGTAACAEVFIGGLAYIEDLA